MTDLSTHNLALPESETEFINEGSTDLSHVADDNLSLCHPTRLEAMLARKSSIP